MLVQPTLRIRIDTAFRVSSCPETPNVSFSQKSQEQHKKQFFNNKLLRVYSQELGSFDENGNKKEQECINCLCQH